jgi:hypothetical protein
VTTQGVALVVAGVLLVVLVALAVVVQYRPLRQHDDGRPVGCLPWVTAIFLMIAIMSLVDFGTGASAWLP